LHLDLSPPLIPEVSLLHVYQHRWNGSLFPEPSNFGGPPAEPGVYLKEINVDATSLKILFVEDNPVNITFGTSLLKKLGHEAVLANNGQECLAALDVGSYDIVLMDIQMPVMNGDDAMREIRRKELITFHYQPVLALTAYALRGEREYFLDMGFDGYVFKPLSIKELVAEMQRVMDLAGERSRAAGEDNHV
jgi:CheY-like chemotaxis protein